MFRISVRFSKQRVRVNKYREYRVDKVEHSLYHLVNLRDRDRLRFSIVLCLFFLQLREMVTIILSSGAFHLVTQIDTNIILSFLIFNK